MRIDPRVWLLSSVLSVLLWLKPTRAWTVNILTEWSHYSRGSTRQVHYRVAIILRHELATAAGYRICDYCDKVIIPPDTHIRCTAEIEYLEMVRTGSYPVVTPEEGEADDIEAARDAVETEEAWQQYELERDIESAWDMAEFQNQAFDSGFWRSGPFSDYDYAMFLSEFCAPSVDYVDPASLSEVDERRDEGDLDWFDHDDQVDDECPEEYRQVWFTEPPGGHYGYE